MNWELFFSLLAILCTGFTVGIIVGLYLGGGK